MTTEPATRIDRPLMGAAFILVLGTFMVTLDGTIVSVGIETLTREFGATVTEIQWVSTAYLLAVVTAVPASGWLADRFGGRRVWMVGIGVFLLASLLCALAWSLWSLVLFRVLQGLSGGLLPPTGQALLARIAGPKRIGRVISVVAVVPLLSPVLGPLAGGTILAVADWPWLFAVNVPIGLVAVLLARRFVPTVPPGGGGAPFDFRGAALLSPGLAVLVFGLTGLEGSDVRAIPVGVAIGAVAVGALMVVGFVLHGLRYRGTPLIDPRLFTRPPFGAAALALAILGASVFGAMFLLPLFLQTGRGLTPFEAGLLLAPQGLGALIGSIGVNRTIDRVAPRTLVLTGIGLVALGTVVMTQLGSGPPDWLLGVSLLVRGLGAAMIGAPVMTIVYANLEPAHLPRASGALNLLNTVGGSIGTALVAVILQTRLDSRPDLALAFGDTFWWVLGLLLVAAAGATRLPNRRKGT